ncbi:alpha-glucuronidase family glycosyl hydrolase [Virgibacillus sp. L01]|uniref:alpha-glucuronidase family glycosyl hydrolase n=1 Tax=Virgibacillus sp. L01 TaxID=3457429 RepID=UPI003FCF69FA
MFLRSIIYNSSHATIKFAADELQRLIANKGLDVEVQQSLLPASINYDKIFIMLEAEYNKSAYCVKPLQVKKDGFALIEDKGNVWIVGKEERSTLYGVYNYCEKKYRYQWIGINEEISHKVSPTSANIYGIQEPLFSRRGNVIETINDYDYIRDLIDWGIKSGLNEFFFTFFLWDEIKQYIREDLVKRSVNVTLGGHSLNYLLNEIKNDYSYSSFKEADGFSFFTSIEIQDLVINKITDICTADPIISRISLWPEDVGIDEKRFSNFMSSYIAFIERLKFSLKEEQLNVEVEHIVYNAGLVWNMLERNAETKASEHVDVLYAYWGRDYSQSIHASSPEQERAYSSLIDWRDQTSQKGQGFTVLEYYSDHFMLSELFPPLLSRIKSDFTDYKEHHIDGVLNLVVPLHEKNPSSERASKYPWKWIHQLNNYLYAGLSWGKDFDSLLDSYFSVFGKDKEKYRLLLLDLEKILSRHTKWNVPLFPARVVDPEKVISDRNDKEIIDFLQKIIDFFTDKSVTSETIFAGQSYKSLSTKDMTLVYFSCLKKIATDCQQAWLAKAQNGEK